MKSKVINKRQCDKFAEVVKKIERAFAECEIENAFLRGRIEERREIMALIASRPVEGKTFSQATRQEQTRLPKATKDYGYKNRCNKETKGASLYHEDWD